MIPRLADSTVDAVRFACRPEPNKSWIVDTNGPAEAIVAIQVVGAFDEWPALRRVVPSILARQSGGANESSTIALVKRDTGLEATVVGKRLRFAGA